MGVHPSQLNGPWTPISNDPKTGQRRWAMRDPHDPDTVHIRTESRNTTTLASSRFDGPWMLLSEHPDLGQRRWIRRDDEDPNKWHVRTETWATSLIAEANEAERKEAAGQRFGNGFRKVASIPMNVLYGKELLEAHRNDDQPYIRKFLNKPENRWMRTHEGQL